MPAPDALPGHRHLRPPLRPPVTSPNRCARRSWSWAAAGCHGPHTCPRPPASALHPARQETLGSRFAIADTTGRDLTYGKALIAAMLLAEAAAGPAARGQDGRDHAAGVGRRRAREHRRPDGRQGARQPELHGGQGCRQLGVEQCGIRTILTSRALLKQAETRTGRQGSVFIEDLLSSFSMGEKLLAAVRHACCRRPSSSVSATRPQPDSDAWPR